jgi:hypothetical protein
MHAFSAGLGGTTERRPAAGDQRPITVPMHGRPVHVHVKVSETHNIDDALRACMHIRE